MRTSSGNNFIVNPSARPMPAAAILKNGSRVALQCGFSSVKEHKALIHTPSVTHTGKSALAVARIELGPVDLRRKSALVFRQGFYMPSDPSGFYVLRAGQNAPAAGNWKPADYGALDFVSHSMFVLKSTGAGPLLAGFTTFNRFDGYFRFNTRGQSVKLSVVYDINLELPAGQSLRLESFMVVGGACLRACLDAYTGYVAGSARARVPRCTVTGWSDWQYYREEKNERDVMASVNAMKPMVRRGFPLKYVIIDGGWCAYASEWTQPCAKFPDMPRLARRLRRAGFELGIWLAPYLANVKTEVVRRHPEWMVMDEKTRKPLRKPASNVGPCCLLDFTVPAAREWLRMIVRMMVRDWKIGYLKLDGPCLAHYRGGKFHNPNMTAIEQVRKSLEVIRAECGERVIVEGEGVYGPSIGFVDTQRTTQDNSPMWYRQTNGAPRMKENLKNDLLSAFLHGRFWHNHRENVILRDFPSPFHGDKAVNPDLKDMILPRNELLCQLSAGVLAGGAMLLTDPMRELLRNPGIPALISQFLPHYEAPGCYPVDVFQGGRQPSIYCLPVKRDFESWFVIGVFNWEDCYSNYRVPLKAIARGGAWHAYEFWSETYLGRFTGALPVNDVPAHGCRVIALRRDLGRPQMVGNNLHVLQGAVDVASAVYAGRQLALTVNHFYQAERKICVYYPARFKLRGIETNARDYLVDARRRNLVTVHYTGRRRTLFKFAWQA